MTFSFSILVASVPTKDSRILASHIHSAFGCHADLVHSEKEMSASFSKNRPDILLVDTNPTTKTFGISTIRKMRKSYPDLLIIPLIPVKHRDLVQEIHALNVFLYIYTPVEKAETVAALTRAGEHLEKNGAQEQSEDIPLLIDTFVHDHAAKNNLEPFTFSTSALAALVRFRWGRDFRELKNLIQHMTAMYSGKTIELDDLPEKYQSMREVSENHSDSIHERNSSQTVKNNSADTDRLTDVDWDNGHVDFRELINSFETQLIVKAMEMSAGNKMEAARRLNLKRTTLLEKIKKKELNSLWEK